MASGVESLDSLVRWWKFQRNRFPSWFRWSDKSELLKKADSESGRSAENYLAVGETGFCPSELTARIEEFTITDDAVTKLSVVKSDCRPVELHRFKGSHSAKLTSARWWEWSGNSMPHQQAQQSSKLQL
jgi:hypothetical protein